MNNVGYPVSKDFVKQNISELFSVVVNLDMPFLTVLLGTNFYLFVLKNRVRNKKGTVKIFTLFDRKQIFRGQESTTSEEYIYYNFLKILVLTVH